MNKDLTVKFDGQEGIPREESERFEFVNFSHFMDIVSRNNALDRVGKIVYDIDNVSVVETYVELNGEYVRSSTMIRK